MRKLDVLLRRDELYLEPQHVAQRAVRVREAEEQIGFLRWRANRGAAITQQDLHLLDGFVDEAVLERGRLDANSADSSANGDGLELRHDGRKQAELQGLVGKFFVACHALDLGDAAAGIDAEHMMERPHVNALRAGLDAMAKQVRGGLRKTDVAAACARPSQLADESLAPLRIRWKVGRCH